MNFIIYNTYIIFAGIVFIQMKGIPMGGNSSSPIADLTIGKREFNYMINLIKQKKYGLAKLLSSCCRYVDDLMAINYLFFHNIIEEIYPESLKMERSGSNNKNVNYLDLNICIKESSLEITVYNKTDDFNFDVVSLTSPIVTFQGKWDTMSSTAKYLDTAPSAPNTRNSNSTCQKS